MENKRSDAMLMEILAERKTINNFLEAVFGFLKRNTDFYHIKKDDSDNVGFPSGMKEILVLGMMRQCAPDCNSNQPVAEDNMESVPPAVQEVEIVDNSQEHQHCQEGNSEASTTNSLRPDNSAQNTSTIGNNSTKEVLFDHTDFKNGACFETYCWSQSIKDVDIQILIPDHLRSSNSLSVNIAGEQLKVRDTKEAPIVLLEGLLSNKCKKDIIWTISGNKLLISLEKLKEMWWEKLLITEPHIDIKKIDSERYIDELPESSQAEIEKCRLKQRKKDQNVDPTTGRTESETIEILRSAWNVEGSPFRGQPFDPRFFKFY